jgi:hypothetical protein
MTVCSLTKQQADSPSLSYLRLHAALVLAAHSSRSPLSTSARAARDGLPRFASSPRNVDSACLICVRMALGQRHAQLAPGGAAFVFYTRRSLVQDDSARQSGATRVSAASASGKKSRIYPITIAGQVAAIIPPWRALCASARNFVPQLKIITAPVRAGPPH